jgi:hypothetical protein
MQKEPQDKTDTFDRVLVVSVGLLLVFVTFAHLRKTVDRSLISAISLVLMGFFVFCATYLPIKDESAIRSLRIFSYFVLVLATLIWYFGEIASIVQ